MRNPRLIICGPARSAARSKQWSEAPAHRLRIGKGKADVHLHTDHLHRKMCFDPPDIVTDMLEVAAYVYAADQAVRRGGTDVFEYGRKWDRDFRFEIPVRCPEVWNNPEIDVALRDTLGFLSEDNYEFVFTRYKNPPPLGGYLFNESTAVPERECQEVLLFSGGLDSLGGAVQEVLQSRRKVALVSHRPVSKLYHRQCTLVGELDRHVDDPRLRPLHVGIEVNKGKGLGRDFTQRTRSFLFATLAAVVAHLFRLSRIRFYENGVTSLNLPISPQLTGARASRTTHPKVIKGFGRLFSLLFGSDFMVENLFQWKTKADVFRAVKAAGYAKLCGRSSSCIHTHAMSAEGTHCGRCSQCVDRRLSALAAGLGADEDPPKNYRSDVLTGAREGTELTLIERYCATARRMAGINDPLDLLKHFPEVSRALPHLNLPHKQAAQRVVDLCQRHGSDVCRALAEAVERKADDLVQQRHPVNCLLSVAVGRRAAPLGTAWQDGAGADPGQRPSDPHLNVDADTFTAFFGKKQCFLGHGIEFRLLARLNQRPGVFVSYENLSMDVWRSPKTNKNTIQRTVCNLVRKIREAGITGIRINGKTAGHYQLVVVKQSSSSFSAGFQR
jgi:hypothetical protein